MSNRKLNINWKDAKQVRAYRTEWMRNARAGKVIQENFAIGDPTLSSVALTTLAITKDKPVRWRDICRQFLPLLNPHPRAAYMRKFRRRKRGAE